MIDACNMGLLARLHLYRFPSDSYPVLATIQPGQIVGVVYSYLIPRPELGRAYLWWVFLDDNGVEYYAEHRPGVFDTKFLMGQGVRTTGEKWWERVFDWDVKGASVGLLGLLAIGTYLVRKEK